MSRAAHPTATPQATVKSDTPYADDLRFALALAAEAAAIARAQYGASVARRKADGSLVTHTDEEIDRLISQRVAERCPADSVLSEEQATIFDPAIARTWIVDPIDGTTNFARGLPTWGVSIALLEGLRPVVGVVNFPLLDETFSAVLGQGAQRNSVPIQTAQEEGLDDENLFMECTRTRRAFTFRLPLKSRMLGSAAYHICKVADGSAVAGSEATPKVWDMAAALLILEEAGGVLRTLEDAPVFPLEAVRADYKQRPYMVLYAANSTLLAQVRAAMQPARRS